MLRIVGRDATKVSCINKWEVLIIYHTLNNDNIRLLMAFESGFKIFQIYMS